MNILVVDDEVVMVDSIRIGLESRGYQVVEAYSAHQALELLAHDDHRIDLVITDYLMTPTNGLELLAAIRKHQPTLPVIIMTAYGEKGLVVQVLKNRGNSFIDKPFSLEQLVAEIENIKPQVHEDNCSGTLKRRLPRIVHQINNPLTAITGYTELILLNRSNGEALQKYVYEILAAVKQISLINKNIMNAGQTEEGRFEPIEVEALLDKCLEMFNGLLILENIQVARKATGQGLRVLGHRYSLEQVFKNLILNAIESMAGRVDRKLSISVTSQKDSSSIEISIEDTGCGIREELLTRIFDPYYTDKHNGNGLGLEVIKHIVEKHGGKVLVKSQLEIGSTFSVHLPGLQMAGLRDHSPRDDEEEEKIGKK